MTLLSALKRTIQAAIISILSISCTVSIPQSTISYIDPTTKQSHPWPKVTDETEEYKVSVEPLGNIDNILGFAIEVDNKGLDSLYLDPREWKMPFALRESDAWIPLDTLSVLETEQVAEVHHTYANKLQQAKNNSDAALILIGIILIVGVVAIAMSADGDSDDSTCDDDEYFYLESSNNSYSSSVHNDLSPNQKISYLNMRANEIRKGRLEPTILLKGESAAFDIHFPRRSDMQIFKLIWEMNDKDFEWSFRHDLQPAR